MGIRYDITGLTFDHHCQLRYALTDRIITLEGFLAATEGDYDTLIGPARENWRRDLQNCYELRGNIEAAMPYDPASRGAVI